MIQEIEDREFDRYIAEASVPVLIEFWQPGCGHCQALLHELELVQEELVGRIIALKMNVQENYLIPADLEIQSLPALALFATGEFQTFIGGIGKKKELLQQLEPWIPTHQSEQT
ncbi:MAG: thioredoxin family protein [Nitrospirales bacterium]